ncbi:MAG: hypothetical protein DHS20C14_22470 [Phycisphaeraceae bacterium]|nr:MAG: hypothetical protein DHS20C14_22470 [Phycisphaeraceae bacterium]
MNKCNHQDTDRPGPGPDPERLKIDGDWEDRMGEALDRPRPEKGWPKDGEPGPDDDKPADEGGPSEQKEK